MKTLWQLWRRALGQLTRPVVNRFDAHLASVLRLVLHQESESSVTTLRHLSIFRDELMHHIGTLGARLEGLKNAERLEIQLIVDGVVRELIRLQNQVDSLAELVAQPAVVQPEHDQGHLRGDTPAETYPIGSRDKVA